ncbi:MAG: peptidylprolyl isomerase [Candidatus Lambdaproteobacteria bacterium]|nr:peptidylprolyl isomerase [Candidatus Lambdaproteobacteria bacterium]
MPAVPGALLLAAVVLAWAPAAPLAAPRVLVDRVQIVVDERMLTAREVTSYRELRLAQITAQYSGAERESLLSTLDNDVVDELVQRLLLESRARDLKITVSDEELQGRVDAIISRDPVAARQYAEDQLKDYVLKDILTRRVLQREVYANIAIPREEVAAECRRQNHDSREIDVGHILVRGQDPQALDKAREIRRRLLDGAPFEALAAAESQDPAVARNRGRLGFISRGQFVKAFEDAAFGLPVGTVSEPVHTEFGYHIVKVFGERARQNVDCERMDSVTANRIHDQLAGEARAKELQAYFKRLRAEADIRVLTP